MQLPQPAVPEWSSLSGFDDFPVHQAAEPVRHAATSDRNFYDRYYFNCFDRGGQIMAVFGMGVYPNLGIHDAFVMVNDGETQRVVRASRPITDRSDLTVGPISVEPIEPLKRLRVVCDGVEHGVALDLMFDAAGPAFEEEPHRWRSHGRTMIETMRFAQVGSWTGTLQTGSDRYDVTPDAWWSTRDRSWGVRPIGEDEPAGIHGLGLVQDGFLWNYAPMRFDDHTFLYMCQERSSGLRDLETAVRVYHDGRPRQHLGRPDHEHRLAPGTRFAPTSTLRFPAAPGGPIEVDIEVLQSSFLQFGTGYGRDPDWRHGMYQGPDLVVGGVEKTMTDLDGIERFLVDASARFTYTDPATGVRHVGYGLHEFGFFGPFPSYGLHDLVDTHDPDRVERHGSLPDSRAR
ncbi:MAG TPA: hypothetical protein VGA13_05405 [Acidimicrobiales bacterium]|jgi:hypothetical protein